MVLLEQEDQWFKSHLRRMVICLECVLKVGLFLATPVSMLSYLF